ncbi:MAG: hypothetical protein AMXMBFR84_15690 [Candidatus Hydrogenedentota bacterium]
MIGTELLLGQIVDTNASMMGRHLADNGIPIYLKTTVGDNKNRIVKVLESALSRADVVLTSGGLGPTEDDLTREAVAEVFGVPLEYHEHLYDELVRRFSKLSRNITPNNKKQAYAPQGATILPNPNGTAPGFRCGDSRGEIVCMPGVPFELEPMLCDQVIPHICNTFGVKGLMHSRVLKVCGVGESRVDAAMGDLMATLENPTIGVLASPEWVRIRITARAETVEEAEARIAPVEAAVRERLPGLIMGTGDDTLEAVVESLLVEKGWTIATAETMTSGMIAQRLTAAGSRQFLGGENLPMAAFKGRATSEQALQWACQTRDRFGAACALAVLANPEDRRLLVAWVCPEGQTLMEAGFGRITPVFQLRACTHALEHVRRSILGVVDPFAEPTSKNI